MLQNWKVTGRCIHLYRSCYWTIPERLLDALGSLEARNQSKHPKQRTENSPEPIISLLCIWKYKRWFVSQTMVWRDSQYVVSCLLPRAGAVVWWLPDLTEEISMRYCGLIPGWETDCPAVTSCCTQHGWTVLLIHYHSEGKEQKKSWGPVW